MNGDELEESLVANEQLEHPVSSQQDVKSPLPAKDVEAAGASLPQPGDMSRFVTLSNGVRCARKHPDDEKRPEVVDPFYRVCTLYLVVAFLGFVILLCAQMLSFFDPFGYGNGATTAGTSSAISILDLAPLNNDQFYPYGNDEMALANPLDSVDGDVVSSSHVDSAVADGVIRASFSWWTFQKADSDLQQQQATALDSAEQTLTFVHDFAKQLTGIVDKERERCLIKPMDKKIKPPSSLVDLWHKTWRNAYKVREGDFKEWRVQGGPIRNVASLSKGIAAQCNNWPVYRLVKKLNNDAPNQDGSNKTGSSITSSSSILQAKDDDGDMLATKNVLKTGARVAAIAAVGGGDGTEDVAMMETMV